jgi:hypothetical protein
MATRIDPRIIVGTVTLMIAGLLVGLGVAMLAPSAAACQVTPHFADARLALAVRNATRPPTHVLSHGPSWARAETCARLGGDLACARYVPRLDVGDRSVTSLSGVECMSSLDHLIVAGNRLTTLEPLAALDRLESLDATRNAITDLEPLRHLARLRELYLWSNAIADASPLVDLPQLEVVDLRANPLDCPGQRPVLANLRTRGVRVLADCPAGVGGADAPRL